MKLVETCEEGQAHGLVKDIYKQIEQSMGVPFVGAIFRSLASNPSTLASVWDQIRPNVETKAFIDLSQRLGRQADALAESTFEFVNLYGWLQDHGFSSEDIRPIRYIFDVFRHLDSDLQLISAAIIVALTEISDPRVVRRKAEVVSTEVITEYTLKVPQVMPEQAPPSVREDYYDILAVMGIPIVPDEYQALGKWPVFLRRAWAEMKPVMRSSTLLDEATSISALAIESAQELPHPIRLNVETDEIRRLAEIFLSLYSRTAMSTAAIRWMLIEGERATRAAGRAAGEQNI